MITIIIINKISIYFYTRTFRLLSMLNPPVTGGSIIMALYSDYGLLSPSYSCIT